MELLLVTLGSLLGGGVLGTAITQFFNRRKTAADASNVTVEAAAKIVNLYSETLEDLRAEVRSLRNRVEQLETEVRSKDIEIAILKAELGSK